jgi:hypothetical protein
MRPRAWVECVLFEFEMNEGKSPTCVLGSFIQFYTILNTILEFLKRVGSFISDSTSPLVFISYSMDRLGAS